MSSSDDKHLFNARFLQEQRKQRQELRSRTYEVTLERIQSRITMANRMNKTSINYSVPEFMMGYPCYNLKDMIVFIIYKLRSLEFKVDFTSPNKLYISWKEEQYSSSSSNNKNLKIKKKKHKKSDSSNNTTTTDKQYNSSSLSSEPSPPSSYYAMKKDNKQQQQQQQQQLIFNPSNNSSKLSLSANLIRRMNKKI